MHDNLESLSSLFSSESPSFPYFVHIPSRVQRIFRHSHYGTFFQTIFIDRWTSRRAGPQENEKDTKRKSSPTSRHTISYTDTGQKWSNEEEREFLEIVNMVVKSGVWPAAKQHGLLAHRGSDGVKKHWDAMVSPSFRLVTHPGTD